MLLITDLGQRCNNADCVQNMWTNRPNTPVCVWKQRSEMFIDTLTTTLRLDLCVQQHSFRISSCTQRSNLGQLWPGWMRSYTHTTPHSIRITVNQHVPHGSVAGAQIMTPSTAWASMHLIWILKTSGVKQKTPKYTSAPRTTLRCPQYSTWSN